jgi:hypothetical protein
MISSLPVPADATSMTGHAMRGQVGEPGPEVPIPAHLGVPEREAASWRKIAVLSADRTAPPGERANLSTSYQRS